MKQKLEISKLVKYFQNNCGLDEAKASVLKELVTHFISYAHAKKPIITLCFFLSMKKIGQD